MNSANNRINAVKFGVRNSSTWRSDKGEKEVGKRFCGKTFFETTYDRADATLSRTHYLLQEMEIALDQANRANVDAQKTIKRHQENIRELQVRLIARLFSVSYRFRFR